MSQRLSTSAVVLVLFAVSGLSPALGAEAADNTWTVPRTIDGKPDLQGVWANNNAIPLQRPPEWQGKERLTDAELADLEAAAKAATNAGQDALFGDQLVLAAIARTKAESYDPTTGNYNGFWVVDRDFSDRTSLVVDPPDGLIPPLTEAANDRLCAQMKYSLRHPADTWSDRPLSERCITYGVPFIGSGYNSYFQIFQSADHVVIEMEMIHDARMIPLQAKPHLDDSIRQWHGDSRGWWDGDTLVIETTNYSPKSDFYGSTRNLHLTERLTLVGPHTLDYELTFDDSTTWTRPWTVSIPLKGTDEAIFEYACHEGNYGMEGMLSGHRAEEAEGKVLSQPDPGTVFRYANLACEDTAAASSGG